MATGGGNLVTGLRRRGTGCSMAQYDRLPAPARAWIAAAVLPWSAASVARLWRRLARDCAGDVAQITARLDLAERRTLAREAARVRRKGSGLSANWAVP